MKNGNITCAEAGGWIDAEEVQEAIAGAEYMVDFNYIKTQIKAKEQELWELHELLNKAKQNKKS